MKVRIQHPISDDELIEFAKLSRVVQLWRNVDCYLAEDPVRVSVEGFPPFIIEIDETDYEKAKARLTHEDEGVRRNAQRVVERYEKEVARLLAKAANMKCESG